MMNTVLILLTGWTMSWENRLSQLAAKIRKLSDDFAPPPRPYDSGEPTRAACRGPNAHRARPRRVHSDRCTRASQSYDAASPVFPTYIVGRPAPRKRVPPHAHRRA